MISKKKNSAFFHTIVFFGSWGWRKFNFKVELKKTPNHIKAFNINGMYFMVDKILIMINRYLYLIKVSYICLWIIPSMKVQTNEAFLLIG